jgi:hypothetical protein
MHFFYLLKMGFANTIPLNEESLNLSDQNQSDEKY